MKSFTGLAVKWTGMFLRCVMGDVATSCKPCEYDRILESTILN